MGGLQLPSTMGQFEVGILSILNMVHPFALRDFSIGMGRPWNRMPKKMPRMCPSKSSENLAQNNFKTHMGVSKNRVFSLKMDGCIMENPMKMDDLGVPLFSETSIYNTNHLMIISAWSSRVTKNKKLSWQ